jgi:hypothetical protein
MRKARRSEWLGVNQVKPTITHTGIAQHNDGILDWLRNVVAKAQADGGTLRFPKIASAFERFGTLASGLIAQTGFLPQGTAAGANEAQINRPFDVVPFPQANGYVIACANPRITDQDAAVTVAILAALAVTLDDSSTHDYLGAERLGGGFTMKKGRLVKVKGSNKTFGAMLRELNITKEGKTFTLADGTKASMRTAGVPEFPADALKLLGGMARKSRLINMTLTLKNGKGKDAKYTDIVVTFRSPDAAILFVSSFKPAVKLATVQDPAVVAKHAEAFAAVGVSLQTEDSAKADAPPVKVAPAPAPEEVPAEPAEPAA